MGSEFECCWDLCSIELIDPDVLIVLASKEVTSIGEDNLTALLDRDALVCFQSLVQYVEELYLIAQTDDQVETGWVEGNRVGLCLGVMDYLVLEVAGVSVGPETRGSVTTAGGDQLLLQADIQTIDGL
jgi:hypothetical protein